MYKVICVVFIVSLSFLYDVIINNHGTYANQELMGSIIQRTYYVFSVCG